MIIEYIKVYYNKLIWLLSLIGLFLFVVLSIITFLFEIYWMINYLYILAFAVIITTIIAGVVETIRTVFSKRKYEKDGSLSLWYKNRKNKLGEDWIIDLAKKIENLPLNHIKLLSPSANEGYIEKVLFNELVKSKQVIVQCSDMSKIEHREMNAFYGDDSEYNYVQQPIEASEVSFLGDKNANIVYDIKGALWYAGKKNNEWRKLIDHYHSLTEEQGYLIIDAEYIFPPKLLFNQVIAKMFFNPIAQENSTYYRAKKENIEYLESKYTLVEKHEIKIKNHTLGFRIYKKK